MELDIINSTNPTAGDITVRRKMDTVQIVRHPSPTLATLTAEEAIKLADELQDHAAKILQATAADG